MRHTALPEAWIPLPTSHSSPVTPNHSQDERNTVNTVMANSSSLYYLISYSKVQALIPTSVVMTALERAENLDRKVGYRTRILNFVPSFDIHTCISIFSIYRKNKFTSKFPLLPWHGSFFPIPNLTYYGQSAGKDCRVNIKGKEDYRNAEFVGEKVGRQADPDFEMCIAFRRRVSLA